MFLERFQMIPVSIVIITHNEAETIRACLNACKLISDDIIMIDNGSTDGTPDIGSLSGCRVLHESWDGYGANKNKGILHAKYDWVLSIDADEIPDMDLVRSLHQTVLHDPLTVYDIRFITYYGEKPVRFGSWGRDHHIRLFNRNMVKWDEPPVHENLVMPPAIQVKKLKGHIRHYSIKDLDEGRAKALHYARLSAEKYSGEGKKATMIKLYLAPAFHFIKNYIIYLGLLDGRRGFNIARMVSRNTYMKYRLLRKLGNRLHTDLPVAKESLVMEY
ncbi:MAG: glycosyltransferase family 2 protein [Bacteroidetes bacterium]|nr:glycosyltransferase family 2 protein [Bacteroidota bacterium]